MRTIVGYIGVLMLLSAYTALSGCGSKENSAGPTLLPAPVSFDLDSIRKRGSLILLTENSASTYYLYRGRPTGFDYEMMKALANYLGVKLEVRIMDDVDKMFEMLNRGEGDIIASNLTVFEDRSQMVAFSSPVYSTRQVLVQRRYDPQHPDSLFPLISDTTALWKLPIWVHRYSSFYDHLSHMAQRSGRLFQLQEAPGEISTEDLIRLTAAGEITATVTDENLAMIAQFDYPELDMNLPVSGEQDIAFALRKNAPKLTEAVNVWLSLDKTKKKLGTTYDKYFKADRRIGYKGPFVLPMMSEKAISPYDSLFRVYSKECGWPWQLLAALAFQESRFNPNAESWSGAYGLMQLMPETAKKFGCDSAGQIEANIRAGARYIRFLDRFWQEKIRDREERLKFVLASYNIGPGHILDAKVIATALARPDTVWFGNVAECLLLKTQEKYYTMDGVKHGYCHAREPYEFVTKVLAVYEYYRSKCK